MKIAINALQVRAAKSGVGHYIGGLLDGLLETMAEDDQLIVYATPFNAPNYRRDDPRVRTVEFGPARRRAIRLAHEWIRFPDQLRRDSPDILHGPANFLPRHCPCPAVVTIHDLSRWADPVRFGQLNRRYWYWMTSHTLRSARRVITVSQASRNDLIRYLKIDEGGIDVIHEAAHSIYRPLPDCRADSAGLEKYLIGGPFILHVGTLEPGKNLARLIDAFGRFRAEAGRDYRLVLAGDRGWRYDDIFDAIAQNHLEERVRILGHVPDEDLPLLYNACEFFVFPALNEGFGLPPLEAMACGAPVIASDRSALPEVLGDAPLYVNPFSTSEIAEAMAAMADSHSERDRHSDAGLEQARLYSWTETARQTLDVYRKVLEE